MDLEKFTTDMLELAKTTISKGDEVIPTVFLLLPTGDNEFIACLIGSWDNLKEKRGLFAEVSKLAKQFKAVVALSVCDSWTIKTGVDYKPGIDPPPSRHPDRVDALVATLIMPDASMAGMTVIRYTRQESGGINWEPPELMGKQGDGSEQNMLPPWGELGLTQ
jgi:hypothetical protein